jgi:hypothetical protein
MSQVFTLSKRTSRKIDWSTVTDTIGLTLDQLSHGRGGGAEGHSPADAVDPAIVRQAFQHVEAEFKRVLEPLRGQMKVVSALVLVSLAIMVAGAALAFVNPWGGSILSLGGVGSVLGLLVRAWQLSRDQAMLELIPARYSLALQLCSSPQQCKQILTQFLSETSSLRKV